MRLVCPNCDAKYEVPDDAVPEDGRDVQCSSCGHAWFQLRPEAEIAAEEEAALFGDDLPTPEDKIPEPVGMPPAEVEPAAIMADAADPLDAYDANVNVEAPPETDAAIAAVLASAENFTPPPLAVQQDLDAGVLSVLREEAEREVELRRSEAQRDGAKRAEAEGQMQTQPDLGMDDLPAASAALSPTQRRLAMLKGKDPDAPPPEPARPTARRDLLPDVEEINSTLQPSENAIDLDAEIDALPDLTKRRSGFRSGFFLMILLMVIAAAVYVAAPKLIAQFPGMEGALTGYVGFVDGLRLWLNDLMNNATQALNGTEG